MLEGSRSRPALTHDRIVQVAVRLADEGGLAEASMRKVATELAVEAMSLYHHVRDKSALLDGMVDQVMSEVELPCTGDPWRPAMTRRAESMRSAIARHPWVVPLLDSRSEPGEATLRHHEAVLASLRADGFSLREAAHAFSVLDSFVFGFALQEQNVPFADTEAEIAEMASALVDAMDPATYPNLRDLAVDVVLQPGYSFGAEFEIGLQIVLDGLELRRR